MVLSHPPWGMMGGWWVVSDNLCCGMAFAVYTVPDQVRVTPVCRLVNEPCNGMAVLIEPHKTL